MIVLALPVPLIEKLVNAKSEEQLEGTEEEDDSDDTLNFRDLLKARTLHLDVPTQIVWPPAWTKKRFPSSWKVGNERSHAMCCRGSWIGLVTR